jgi:hypothetical protein
MDLLQLDLLWRVGDGHSISVWNSKWLPTQTTYQIQSTPRILGENVRVSSLIKREHGCWNEELINDVFEATEANVIKAIPLNPFLPPDRLLWRGTSDGVFTVRSAYHFGNEFQVMLRLFWRKMISGK